MMKGPPEILKDFDGDHQTWRTLENPRTKWRHEWEQNRTKWRKNHLQGLITGGYTRRYTIHV